VNSVESLPDIRWKMRQTPA